MPVLSILTTCANALIIVVLSRPKMASPTNTILLAMACCDLLTILLPGPWFIYTYTLDKLDYILYKVFVKVKFQIFSKSNLYN